MNLTDTMATILKYFLTNKLAKRERISDYLNEIATDARELSELWQIILTEHNKGVINPGKNKRIDKKIDKFLKKSEKALVDKSRPPHVREVVRLALLSQLRQYTKLESFYYTLTTVMGDKVTDEFRESFIYVLGSLLRTRNLAKENIEYSLMQLKKQYFLDERNSAEDIKKLEDLVATIQREAAALDVLSKTYRASI